MSGTFPLQVNFIYNLFFVIIYQWHVNLRFSVGRLIMKFYYTSKILIYKTSQNLLFMPIYANMLFDVATLPLPQRNTLTKCDKRHCEPIRLRLQFLNNDVMDQLLSIVCDWLIFETNLFILYVKFDCLQLMCVIAIV